MGRIQVLDCTLRDGGYCNQWKFGYENAKKIISSLVNAGVEIIECGFITKRVEYDNNITKFTDVAQIRGILPQSNDDKMFVAMMNYGECDLKALPKYDGSSINGIRVAFHKKDAKEALKLCEAIKEKGYLVFIQAMVSLSYSDEEFLSMIKQVNDLEPYAFYIVDSFGEMKKSDLTRLYYLVEHNLKESIKIGFHSHNNIQLAYSNAQTLVDMHTNRELIIDSSVYGMGRGAGNLNTELFVEYLNENNGANYDLKPLLTIIDEILNDFYQSNYWGYSLPNYISATHHAHPNYASYLDDKKTLTVENMNEIFDLIEDDKRVSFDKDYIEDLYIRFMTTGKVHEEHKLEFTIITLYYDHQNPNSCNNCFRYTGSFSARCRSSARSDVRRQEYNLFNLAVASASPFSRPSTRPSAWPSARPSAWPSAKPSAHASSRISSACS